jgi:hypothetical protein
MLFQFLRNIVFAIGFYALVALGLEAFDIVPTGFSWLDPVTAFIALGLGWRLALEKDLSPVMRAVVLVPVVLFLYNISSLFGSSFLASIFSILYIVVLTTAGFILLGTVRAKKVEPKAVDGEIGKYPIYLDDTHLITTKLVSEHIQIIGKTGSGKSESYFGNAKWQSIHQGKGSFIFDAKSDEFDKMAYYVSDAERVPDYIPFDLLRPDRSFRINPLAWFKKEKDAEGNLVPDSGVVADIVAMSVYYGYETKEDYYPGQGKGFLSNFTFLFLRKFPIITYADFYHVVTAELDELTSLKILIDEFPDTNEAKYLKKYIVDIPALDRRKILSGVLALLSPFVIGDWAPLINTTTPDVFITDIIDKNKIFHFGAAALVYPNVYQKISVAFLMALMVEAGRRGEKEINVPFDLFLDEFASIAYPGFAQIIATVRSRGIGCHLGHQSLGDLDRAGGAAFRSSIMDNTTTKIIFRVVSHETADILAKTIGTREADLFMVRSFKTNAGLFSTHQEAGVTEKGVNERQFYVSPDELKSLDVGEAAVVITYNNGIKRFKMRFPYAPQPLRSFDMTLVVPQLNHHKDKIQMTLPIESKTRIKTTAFTSEVKPIAIKSNPNDSKIPFKTAGEIAKIMRAAAATKKQGVKGTEITPPDLIAPEPTVLTDI